MGSDYALKYYGISSEYDSLVLLYEYKSFL